MQIAIIGGGVMGEVILRNVLSQGLAEARSVTVADVRSDRRTYLGQNYGITAIASNSVAVEPTPHFPADVVILAVPPGSLPQVMNDLRGNLSLAQLLLSIVAGAKLTSLVSGIDHRNIVRAMPNMPAQIGEGITIWTATSEVSDEGKAKAKAILATLGKEIFISEEKYLDMATAVSGSGPAYVFTIIESLIDGAVHIGLPHQLAKELVIQTILGATRLVEKSGRHPAELRELVSTPAGTTVEGLLKLEEAGLRAIFIQAIASAYKKAQGLSSD
jgi:pyrroline-5-carboxylate reductase